MPSVDGDWDHEDFDDLEWDDEDSKSDSPLPSRPVSAGWWLWLQATMFGAFIGAAAGLLWAMVEDVDPLVYVLAMGIAGLSVGILVGAVLAIIGWVARRG